MCKKKALFSIEKRAPFEVNVRAIDADIRTKASLKAKYINSKNGCQEIFPGLHHMGTVPIIWVNTGELSKSISPSICRVLRS
jgi:hypothetical protein